MSVDEKISFMAAANACVRGSENAQRRVRLANDRGVPRRGVRGVAEPEDRSGSERLLSAHDL